MDPVNKEINKPRSLSRELNDLDLKYLPKK
jgi:hypothetical protein